MLELLRVMIFAYSFKSTINSYNLFSITIIYINFIVVIYVMKDEPLQGLLEFCLKNQFGDRFELINTFDLDFTNLFIDVIETCFMK